MASTTIEAKEKKVILFGLTGDGKSTVANVLVAGGLEPVFFPSSASARVCTSAIHKQSGRGWFVTDTIGLGQADTGAMAKDEADNMFLDFVKEVRDEYSHIIYVQKARRITKLEQTIWKLFAKIFEGAEESFVILFTAATPEWLEENRDKLPEYWKSHTVLSTNIPPIHKRPAIERRLKVIRERSIAKLEQDLEKLFEDRGNKYSTPKIAKMSEEQLKGMARSKMSIFCQINRLFDIASRRKAAANSAVFPRVPVLEDLNEPLLADKEREKGFVPNVKVMEGKNLSSVKKEAWKREDNKMNGQEVEAKKHGEAAEAVENALHKIIRFTPECIVVIDGQVQEMIAKLGTNLILGLYKTPFVKASFNIGSQERFFPSYNRHDDRVLSTLIELWQILYKYAVFVLYKSDGSQLLLVQDSRRPFLLKTSTPDESRVLEPITEPLVPHGIPANVEKGEDDSYATGEVKIMGDQEVAKNDSGLVAETKMRASGTSFVKAFGREVKEGCEDGYFVSSKWLLSLEEHERNSLMSVLWRGGFSKTCQTTSTILFARTENHTSRKSREEPACLEDINSPEFCDDLLGIAGKSLNTDKKIAIADVFGSNNLVETSSLNDHGGTLVNTLSTERPAVTLQSFKAALKSRSIQSFCVSTTWLSNLKDEEKETLVTLLKEAGYEKISQTSTRTWYQRIRGRARNQVVGACDRRSSSSSDRNDVVGGEVKESRISKLFGYFRLTPKVDGENNTCGSSRVANMMDTNTIQGGDSSCRAQTLTAACSSSTCLTPGAVSQSGDFYRQEFGDSVGHWPAAKSENISTTIEKSFKIPTLDFVTDEGGTEVATQALISLKAFATTSLSCCLRIGTEPPKIRIKFSRISAEVKNKEPEEENEEPKEESCNAMVLSYLCTNVYSCIKRTDSDGKSDQIVLDLEDEYTCPPGKRVLAYAQHSWLEKSGITPNNSEPGSTSLVLQSEIEKRRRHDSGRPHPLLFQDTRPVVFEGNINSGLYLNSFLKFHVRHELEVSYFKPSRAILEEGPVWTANNRTKPIDFLCCVEIKSENISVDSVRTK